MEITINQNENQLIRIGNSNTQDINITENENQDIEINNTTPQNLNINQPETQTILIDGGGAVIGITDVLVNGVTVVSGNIAYVIVPTKLSQLQNDTHFITTESDPTVPNYVKQISLADITNWNNKQNELVSGSTIKTINNESLLGSGNIQISGTQYSAGYGIDITNDIITNVITSYNDLVDLPTIPSKTSDLINDSDFVSENELAEVAFDGSYASLSNTPTIPDSTSELINDGNGTYPFMLNKAPSYIDGIGLYGGSSAYARNLSYIWDSGAVTETKLVANYDDIPTTTSQLTNDSNFAVTNSNNNFSTTQTFTKVEATTNVSTPNIEISSATPYIDFHFNNTTTDFTSRIIENASGNLQFNSNINIIKALRGFEYTDTIPFGLQNYNVTLSPSQFNFNNFLGAVLIVIGGWSTSTTQQTSIYLLSWSGGTMSYSSLNPIVQGQGTCTIASINGDGTLTLTINGNGYNIISLF